MRYLFVLTALVACAPKTIPQLTTVSGFDLTPYTAKGFLFSPNPYSGAHDPVGLVTVTVYSAASFVEGELRVTPLSGQVVLDTVYTRARAMGADAFVQMDVVAVSRMVSGSAVPGLQVSGFAIRRK